MSEAGGGAADAGFDVVVVGGGPAGSTVAGLLALRSRRVILLDRARFPRPKPCGECLNPGAVRALERLGLLDVVLALGPAPLSGWTIRTSGHRAEGRFGEGLRGLGVPRSELDAALLTAAGARGVDVWEGIRVTDVTPAPEPGTPAHVTWRASDGSEGVLSARVVVGADGLRSTVSRALGLVARAPKLRKVSLTCHVTHPGTVNETGVLDVEDGVTLGIAPVHRTGDLWNATVVADSERWGPAVAADPEAFALGVLKRRLGAHPACDIVGGPWASGPFDWPVRQAWAPGVVLVGDAAGYFDPFTGQGIYRALRSAELACEAVDTTLRSPSAGWRELRSYGRTLAVELRGGRWLQRVVEVIMARPRLRGPVVDLLARGGALDDVIRVTGDAAPVSSLLRPGLWTGLLASRGEAPC